MKLKFGKLLSILTIITLTFATACSAKTVTTEKSAPPTTGSTEISLKIGDPVMTVNGEKVNVDDNGSAPIIADGRTLLPIRAVIEAIGGTVDWEQETQTASLAYDDDVIRLVIGSQTAYLNDEPQTLDAAPVIINGRTMLPIRFISESFGFNVNWDDKTQTVGITNGGDSDDNSQTEQTTSATDSDDKKILVAYFSMPDNVDDSVVTIDGETLGNNQYFSRVIQEETGADVFRIEPETPYPTDHKALVDLAAEEQDTNARPAIKGVIENFDDYDVVFVGYPIWWSDMPMLMYSFFDTYDFSGKTLIPFSSHGGSGWAGTPSAIEKLEPDAEILEGLSISRDDIQNARDQIAEWSNDVIGD